MLLKSKFCPKSSFLFIQILLQRMYLLKGMLNFLPIWNSSFELCLQARLPNLFQGWDECLALVSRIVSLEFSEEDVDSCLITTSFNLQPIQTHPSSIETDVISKIVCKRCPTVQTQCLALCLILSRKMSL